MTDPGHRPAPVDVTAHHIESSYGSLLRRLDEVQNPVVRAWLILGFLSYRRQQILGFHVYEQALGSRLAMEVLQEGFDSRDVRLRTALLGELRHLEGRIEGIHRVQISSACARLEGAGHNDGAHAACLEPREAEVKIAATHVEPGTASSLDECPTLGLVVSIRVEVVPPPARLAPPAWDHPLAGYSDGALRSLSAVTLDAAQAVQETIRGLETGSSTPRGRRSSRATLSVPVRLGMAEAGIMVAGDSAGLGLGVLLLSIEWSLRNGGRVGRRPSPTWAWTGVLLPDGRVGAVDSRLLAAKVRAAEGSGLAGIVVPTEQVAEAVAAVPEPGRNGFRVVGAAHLRETLDEPDLWQPWPVRGWLKRLTNRERRRQIITLMVLFVLALLVVKLLPPSLSLRDEDPVPRIVERRMEITVPPGRDFAGRHIQGEGPYSNALISRRFRGLENGTPVLVYTRAVGPRGDGSFHAINLRTGKAIWNFELHPGDLPLPQERTYPGTFTNPLERTLLAANLDADPEDEFVCSISLHPYSPCFIILLDPGTPLRTTFHPGHLEAVSIGDLDGDGRPEIAAAGHHSPSRGVALLVVRPAEMRISPGIAVPWAGEPPSGAGRANRPSAQPPRVRPDSVALHVVIPLPMDAANALGLKELRYDTLEVRNGTPREALFQLDVGFDAGGTCPDFLIQIHTWPLVSPQATTGAGLQDPPFRIVPNACLDSHMNAWRQAGRVIDDYSSTRFLSRWRTDMELSRSVIQ